MFVARYWMAAMAKNGAMGIFENHGGFTSTICREMSMKMSPGFTGWKNMTWIYL
jgi:hypothetical protein